MEEPIDFVVTWVDCSDPKWRKSFEEYVSKEDSLKDDVAGEHRYLENGLFRYWFRGVEKYAPWVNHIYLVTNGQYPSWLNLNNPKLTLVTHDQIMPKTCLPTFNSNAIMLSLPNIPELSEHFVVFNDDMYLVSPCEPSLFFHKGLPRDMGVLDVLVTRENAVWWHNAFNNLVLINHNYRKRGQLKIKKWLNPTYGLKGFYKNACLWRFNLFPGFYEPHLPNSYLKSFCLQTQQNVGTEISQTLTHRVRHLDDITEWYYKQAQLAANKFCPINKDRYGRYCSMSDLGLSDVLTHHKYAYICINDENNKELPTILRIFHRLLPDRSSFELFTDECEDYL